MPRAVSMERSRILRYLLLPLAILTVGAALVRSVLAVWFTSEVVATPANVEVAVPRLSARALLIIVDGLRYDTALESDLMPHMRELASRNAHGQSWASRVTMTGLGVRTIGTGTSPALADLLSNVNLSEVTFDNIFDATRRRGGHVAWVGNPSWKELFGHAIDIDTHISRMLEIVARANTVYPADAIVMSRAVGLIQRADWELCVVHLGGLDNASHMWTPFGELFREKARKMDRDVQRLVDAAKEGTTILITSDHGTSDRGHHGSGEPIARRTPLILLGSGIVPGRTFEAQQTDIAPTIAVLLGLPIPAPAEGRALIEALHLSPDAAQTVGEANARQQQRYADAFGRARGLEPPQITAANLDRLGSWIEETRATNSLLPLGWALVLGVVAVSLVVFSSTELSPIALGLVVVASTAGAILSDRAWLACGVCLIAVLVASGLAARRAQRPALGATLVALGSIAALEAALAAWKLHHRFIEMKAHDVFRALHLSADGFAVVSAASVSVVLGLALRRKRGAEIGPWFVAYALVVLGACGDSLAIPTGIGAGVVVVVALGTALEIALSLAALALAVGALKLVDAPVFDVALLGVVGPAVIAAMGVAFLEGARPSWGRPPNPRLGRSTALVLVAFGVACGVVRLMGDPRIPYRATLLVGTVSALVAAAREQQQRRLETLGWAAAILLATMSRPGQIPGVVAWTLFAALAAPLAASRTSGRSSLLAATLLCVAVRMGFFALFEGAFEFSHLEVWLAYQGNPGTEHVFGTTVLVLKFALPCVLAISLASSRLGARAPWVVTGCVTSFLSLRVAHIVLGMTVARGTFYSPYVDSGQLAFTLLMLASVLVVLLFQALALAPELVARARSIGVPDGGPERP